MPPSVTVESVKPVFIKDKDIGDDTITAINICNAVTRVVGTSKLEGVQKIGSIWRVYLKDMSTRLELTVKEQIVVNGKNVPVYDQNPNHITFKGLSSRQNGNHRPNNDKLTLKNLPLSVSNQEIEKLLKEKNVMLVSPIFYGKIRDENGQLTSFKSGDRYMFVQPFDHPLPRQQEICNFQCLLLHHGKTQTPCKSCNVLGHKVGDEVCPAKPKNPILAFKGYQHPLSNHFACELSVYGKTFKSLEHAYFFHMATEFGKPELAEWIHQAPHAGHAKRLSKDIADDETRWAWEEENTAVMEHLLGIKANQCTIFKQCLLESKDLVIAEATPSKLWGTGFSVYVTERTSQEYWTGKNLLGAMLTDLAQQLSSEESAESQTSQPMDIVSSADLHHTSPSKAPLCSLSKSSLNQYSDPSPSLQIDDEQDKSMNQHADSSAKHPIDHKDIPSDQPSTNQPVSISHSSSQSSTPTTQSSVHAPATQQQQHRHPATQAPCSSIGDAVARSRPKQRNPASQRSFSTPTRSCSTPRTPKSRTTASGHQDIRTVMKRKEPSSSPDHEDSVQGKVLKTDDSIS